jgi:hypothetical protein
MPKFYQVHTHGVMPFGYYALLTELAGDISIGQCANQQVNKNNSEPGIYQQVDNEELSLFWIFSHTEGEI